MTKETEAGDVGHGVNGGLLRELGANASGGAMGNVMTAIAEALVATAIGILVALPAVIAYNVFQKKTQDVEDNVQAIGTLLLAQMKSAQEKR